MKLLARIRTRRRMVFVVLAMWLFALGAGWANACMLQERRAHAHDQDTIAAPIVVFAGHIGSDSAHDGRDDQSAGGKACLKVCDDAAQSVVATPQAFDLSDAALAPPTATLWTAHAADLQIAGIAATAAPPPAASPPLRTRFSRLAL